jgi:hypothetical protein
MTKAFSFSNQLALGKAGEDMVMRSIDGMLHGYDTHPDLQRSGIDITNDKYLIDVKTQAHKYTDSGNLPIEVFSVYEKSKPGWFFSSDADIIVWVYHGKGGKGLWHTGYVMPLTSDLRQWVNKYRKRWRRIRVPNDGRYGKYNAICWLVPIDEFAEHELIPFDPHTEDPSELP